MHDADLDAESTDLDARLREAIDSWKPRRPRRWLAKYGGWRVEKRSLLTQRCIVRYATKPKRYLTDSAAIEESDA